MSKTSGNWDQNLVRGEDDATQDQHDIVELRQRPDLQIEKFLKT